MYTNPEHVKDCEIKARFDRATFEAIEKLAVMNRIQRSVLVRSLVEAALEQHAKAQALKEGSPQ
jgi:hypothetical protein